MLHHICRRPSWRLAAFTWHAHLRQGCEGLKMTDLSRVGRNCVNGKHTIEILEGQERREERLLTNSCVGGPLSSLPLPPSHSRASLGCERSLSTSLGEAKKSRKMDNTLEGILLCAVEPTGHLPNKVRASTLTKKS